MTRLTALLLTAACAACGGKTEVLSENGGDCMRVPVNQQGQTQNVPPTKQPVPFIQIAQGQGLEDCPSYILTATAPLGPDGNIEPLEDLYLVINFGNGAIAGLSPTAYVDIGRGISFAMHGESLNVAVVNESGKLANNVSVFISDGTFANGVPRDTENGTWNGLLISASNALPNSTASDLQPIPTYAQSLQVQAVSTLAPSYRLYFVNSFGVTISIVELGLVAQTLEIPSDAKSLYLGNLSGGNCTSLRYVFDLAL